MKKKYIVGLLLIITILSIVSFGNASAQTYEVINPEKKAYSTMNKVVLVNGKAPTGTTITIDLYGTTDLTRKTFNLGNLPKDEDYIKRLTESATSGNMGFFQKELALVLGVNKVVIQFDETDLSEEIIIYVYDKSNLSQDRMLINLK